MKVLTTSLPGLELVELGARHAETLFLLLKDNRSHLTAHGDYSEQVSASFGEVLAELGGPTQGGGRFGIMTHNQLVGRIDLVPISPPKYGIGYWLAQSVTGKGYATAALRAVVHFAKVDLEATDIFAGVTHGNSRSAAVLERSGFRPVKRFERYTRYHLPLAIAR